MSQKQQERDKIKIKLPGDTRQLQRLAIIATLLTGVCLWGYAVFNMVTRT